MISHATRNCDLKTCDICRGNSIEIIPEIFEECELENEIELIQWTQDVYQLRMKTETKTLKDCIDLFIANSSTTNNIFSSKTLRLKCFKLTLNHLPSKQSLFK